MGIKGVFEYGTPYGKSNRDDWLVQVPTIPMVLKEVGDGGDDDSVQSDDSNDDAEVKEKVMMIMMMMVMVMMMMMMMIITCLLNLPTSLIH